MNSTRSVQGRAIDTGEPILLLDPPVEGVACYVVSTYVCANPDCTCTRMGLAIRAARLIGDGDYQASPDGIDGEVSSDGSNLTIAEDPSGAHAADAIQWIREELTREEHLARFRERWRRMRGQVGDPAYPAPAPPDDLEWLIPFSDLFPYEFDLTVAHGGQRYLALDHYCLNPGCPCDEVVVAFIDLPQGRNVGSVRAPVSRLESARFEGDPVVAELWRAFLEEHDRHMFRKRFRRIGKLVRARRSVPQSAKASNVGRNAPRS